MGPTWRDWLLGVGGACALVLVAVVVMVVS